MFTNTPLPLPPRSLFDHSVLTMSLSLVTFHTYVFRIEEQLEAVLNEGWETITSVPLTSRAPDVLPTVPLTETTTTRTRSSDVFKLFLEVFPYDGLCSLIVDRNNTGGGGFDLTPEQVRHVLFFTVAAPAFGGEMRMCDFLAPGVPEEKVTKTISAKLPGLQLVQRVYSALDRVEVRDVEALFQEKWQGALLCSGNVTVDETMIPYLRTIEENNRSDDPAPLFHIDRKPHPHGMKMITYGFVEVLTGRPFLAAAATDNLQECPFRQADLQQCGDGEIVSRTHLESILEAVAATRGVPGAVRHVIADSWFSTFAHMTKPTNNEVFSTMSFSVTRIGKRRYAVMSHGLAVGEYRVFRVGEVIVTVYRPNERVTGIVATNAYGSPDFDANTSSSSSSAATLSVLVPDRKEKAPPAAAWRSPRRMDVGTTASIAQKLNRDELVALAQQFAVNVADRPSVAGGKRTKAEIMGLIGHLDPEVVQAAIDARREEKRPAKAARTALPTPTSSPPAASSSSSSISSPSASLASIPSTRGETRARKRYSSLSQLMEAGLDVGISWIDDASKERLRELYWGFDFPSGM